MSTNPNVHHGRLDTVTGVTTTGHEWDGIEELNNPLPRWWLWVWYACIVWAIGYWIMFPAWPLISGATPGLSGWHSRTAINVQLEDLRALRAESTAKLANASLQQIEDTPALLTLARAQGRVAFADNCAPCHGQGGGGAVGFPNLNDDDWLWGGSLDQIYQTISYGIRSGDEQARTGSMPAFGRDGILTKPEISAVAGYVRTLSGLEKPGATTEKGKEVFLANCAACHGDDGKGNQELGAPNLTDNIWLYGSDKATIEYAVANGRGNVMPAWHTRLDPTTIKVLTVYVHSLGGGR
ncbi:cytochrome-c oxidase, cbb3-type subunit III [Xanthobacter sp. V4C-4]|uniref:cytochrome-c oxidase, cbb3-type subunit III n=1 Tax=Xanthobacter cornucopiae TaxID=3119924 RepID=UPI00372CE39C